MLSFPPELALPRQSAPGTRLGTLWLSVQAPKLSSFKGSSVQGWPVFLHLPLEPNRGEKLFKNAPSPFLSPGLARAFSQEDRNSARSAQFGLLVGGS